MTNWSSLLSSKCKDRDYFLSFYSKTKSILHKLTKGNLITTKDNVFLKHYFLMAIEATELQTEVKGFLRDTNATYSETLELIHTDFRVRAMGEHLHDTTMRSGSTAIVRRGKTTTSTLKGLNHLSRGLANPPTITESSSPRSTTTSLGSGTKSFQRLRVTALLNK